MSAYIVEDKTINRIITFLASDQEASHVKSLLKTQLGLDHNDEKYHENLGTRMFSLNILAVNTLYGVGEAEKFRPLDYKFHYEITDRIQALKSLRCFLYQCYEGEIPESQLFKILDSYAAELAYRIISYLPAYERADRG